VNEVRRHRVPDECGRLEKRRRDAVACEERFGLPAKLIVATAGLGKEGRTLRHRTVEGRLADALQLSLPLGPHAPLH
jgi:hypothetical protein